MSGDVTKIAMLDYLPTKVVRMMNPHHDPRVAVGPAFETPVGPAVVLGCGLAASQRNPIGEMLGAHMSPDEARQLAGKLYNAAAEVEDRLRLEGKL